MNRTQRIAVATLAATLAYGAAFAAPPPLTSTGSVTAVVLHTPVSLDDDATAAPDARTDASASSGWTGWLPIVDKLPDLTSLVAQPVPEHTTSGYGWRDDPINHHSRFHGGADIHADRGTPVHAAGDGTVIFASRQGGYGNVIYVDHGHGLITRYGHLSKILVKKGEVVAAASEIGRVGATGRATGPHLHFEVRIDGNPVDPTLAMHVAELERTAPDLARLVGMALAPDVQTHWINEQDPPRGSRGKTPAGPRPERRGRTARSRNNS
jgi:murein DD-endopeptidase MepM/ murein hydrolase activator NlpD